eukprot:233773-Amphidinium_carterae.2
MSGFQANIGLTRIEPTSDFKLDWHLPGKASLKEQPGGCNPVKGDAGKDRPSLTGELAKSHIDHAREACVALGSAAAELRALTTGLKNERKRWTDNERKTNREARANERDDESEQESEARGVVPVSIITTGLEAQRQPTQLRSQLF